jgi:hypothetical protein
VLEYHWTIAGWKGWSRLSEALFDLFTVNLFQVSLKSAAYPMIKLNPIFWEEVFFAERISDRSI